MVLFKGLLDEHRIFSFSRKRGDKQGCKKPEQRQFLPQRLVFCFNKSKALKHFINGMLQSQKYFKAKKKTSILYFIDTLSMVIVSSFNMIYDIIKIDSTVNDSP